MMYVYTDTRNIVYQVPGIAQNTTGIILLPCTHRYQNIDSDTAQHTTALQKQTGTACSESMQYIPVLVQYT